MSVNQHIFRFLYEMLTTFGRGVCMGVGGSAAKPILTQVITKGALGCKTLAYWWYFFLSWAKA